MTDKRSDMPRDATGLVKINGRYIVRDNKKWLFNCIWCLFFSNFMLTAVPHRVTKPNN